MGDYQNIRRLVNRRRVCQGKKGLSRYDGGCQEMKFVNTRRDCQDMNCLSS